MVDKLRFIFLVMVCIVGFLIIDHNGRNGHCSEYLYHGGIL